MMAVAQYIIAALALWVIAEQLYEIPLSLISISLERNK
jgi:hypothetical protein